MFPDWSLRAAQKPGGAKDSMSDEFVSVRDLWRVAAVAAAIAIGRDAKDSEGLQWLSTLARSGNVIPLWMAAGDVDGKFHKALPEYSERVWLRIHTHVEKNGGKGKDLSKQMPSAASAWSLHKNDIATLALRDGLPEGVRDELLAMLAERVRPKRKVGTRTDVGVQVKVGAPSPPALSAGTNVKEDWVPRARTRAEEIVSRQRKLDLYPSQLAIADEIAREFRRDGAVGADGKPLSGETIKRHALKGISSAQGKQLSTAIRRGK